MNYLYGKLLLFSDFFSFERKPALDYLLTYPKEDLIHFLVNLNDKSSALEIESIFNLIFVQPDNQEYKYKFLERIKFINQNSIQQNLILINNLTILRILNDIIGVDETKFIEGGNRLSFERNLFSAILSKNQEIEIQQVSAFKLLNLVPFTEFTTQVVIACKLPYSTLINVNERIIFFIQLFKVYQLIQYSKTNLSFQNLIMLFLEKFNFSSTNQYFYYILTFMSEFVNRIKGEIFIPNRNIEKHNELPKFLSKYSKIESGEFSDFINLRANPIFKTKGNHLIILNSIFILDKIYNCFYFELNKINNEKKLESYFVKEFRSNFWCKKFIEEHLFSNLLKEIFVNTEKHFTESHFNSKLFTKNKFSPDYIIKDERSYYIFELKDALIRADTKNSYNFDVIEKEFRKKFIESDRNQRKGILQLVNCIDKIFNQLDLSESLEINDNSDIYPILVLNDECFKTSGINYLLNTWFIEELKKNDLPIEFLKRVKPLTVILIDDLILMKIFGLEIENGFRKILLKYIETVNNQIDFNIYGSTNFSSILEDNLINGELNIAELDKMINELTKKI